MSETDRKTDNAQRTTSSGEAIVANVADYEVAYRLAASVLAETLADLKKPLREAYERIQGLCDEKQGAISRREIREALNLPDSTVRRWLSDLVELEYLVVADAGRQGAGKSARYKLADTRPREQRVIGLLTPKELKACLA